MSADGVLNATVRTDALDPDTLVANLFSTESGSLVRLARIFCDDRNAAEDLVQEAFIRLHRTAGTIRDPARAPAFLRSIVINLARDHNRRGLMSLRHRSATRSPDIAAGYTAEFTAGVEDEAIETEDGRRVLTEVRLLPDRQRACLVLRYYLQLSESETAETLGVSKSSVKTHCRRGLAALERALEDHR